MGITEDLADELAVKVMKYVDASGDEQIVTEIIKVLGATSQTAEEAFMTSLRVRRANNAARELLLDRLRKFQADQTKDAGSAGG